MQASKVRKLKTESEDLKIKHLAKVKQVFDCISEESALVGT